jgi:hypothetical protein
MYRESFEGGLTPKLWFDPTVMEPFNVCSGFINVVSSASRALASPLIPDITLRRAALRPIG